MASVDLAIVQCTNSKNARNKKKCGLGQGTEKQYLHYT
jgi:hypothetical protein